MRIAFSEKAFPDYAEWRKGDKRISAKIDSLIMDMIRDPFNGIGKPERLKHDKQDRWSRRITEEHRLVYYIEDDEIVIVSCKGHYDN